MESTTQTRLIRFLQEELAVPATAIKMVLRHCEQNACFLPILLWQYGIIDIEQLDKIFDWLETIQSIIN